MVRNLAHVILNEVKNLDLLVGSKKNEILRLRLRMTLRPSLFEGQGRVKMIARDSKVREHFTNFNQVRIQSRFQKRDL